MSDSDNEDDIDEESPSPGSEETVSLIGTTTAPAPPESQPTDMPTPGVLPSAVTLSDGAGTSNNPGALLPSETVSPDPDTTQQVVSQITSDMVPGTLSEAPTRVSSSLAQDERANTETATNVDLAATSRIGAEVNSTEESVPAINRGQVAGITVGTLGTFHPNAPSRATYLPPTTAA